MTCGKAETFSGFTSVATEIAVTEIANSAVSIHRRGTFKKGMLIFFADLIQSVPHF